MAIEVENLKQMPEGKHQGVITGSEVTDRVFDGARGPEKVLAVTIQPAQPKDGTFRPLEVVFSPVVNPLSALGNLLERLNMAPDYESGKAWDETSLIGTEITFAVKNRANGFPQIIKDSINPA